MLAGLSTFTASDISLLIGALTAGIVAIIYAIRRPPATIPASDPTAQAKADAAHTRIDDLSATMDAMQQSLNAVALNVPPRPVVVAQPKGTNAPQTQPVAAAPIA